MGLFFLGKFSAKKPPIISAQNRRFTDTHWIWCFYTEQNLRVPVLIILRTWWQRTPFMIGCNPYLKGDFGTTIIPC